MTIPGTKQIPAPRKLHSLFCFSVEPLTGDYLARFFAELDPHVPPFVFAAKTLADIEQRIADGRTSITALEQARKFLQKTQEDRASDSGELGELLLHLFTTKVLKGHKVASKIQSRGSGRTTLPGRDGIFAWRDAEGKIFMLMGEAKVKPDCNDGLRDAQSDVNKFWTDASAVEHELALASTHIPAELSAENLSVYEAFFIEDHERHAELAYLNVILIGYSMPELRALAAGTGTAEAFEKAVVADIERCFKNQEKLIAESPHPSIFCFFPMECATTTRTRFAQHHGLTY